MSGQSGVQSTGITFLDAGELVLVSAGDKANNAIRVNLVAGGTGGGAVTIADGADVAQGTTTDAAWVSGSGTVISLLKKIASAGGGAVSIADGADVAKGATTDAAVTTDVNGTVSGKLRGMVKIFNDVWDSVNHLFRVSVQNTVAAVVSGTVAVSSIGSAVTVNQGGAPWSQNITQIGGSAIVTGTGASGLGIPRVTVSNDSVVGLAAGTNVIGHVIVDSGSITVTAAVGSPAFVRLSDGAAALVGQKAMAASLPVVIASDQTAVPVSGTVTANQGTAAAASGAWPAKVTDGTNVQAVKAASTAAAATDPSAVVQLSPNQPNLTTPLNVRGSKTNNSAAPSTDNESVLIAIANEALPSYTEGNMVLPAYDLRGVERVIDTPMIALGEYEWEGITGVYSGLAANSPLCSFRWGDATRLCQLLRVEVLVLTSTAATVASITERQLILARSFTASDTGGTSATLTGNNQKLRTSDGTSLLTNLQLGAPLTAGTRTLDAAPIASAIGWSGLLSTGIVIGAYGSSPVGAARSTEGGGQFHKLYDEQAPGARKIVFAQNEGFIVRIGAAQPTSAVNQTAVKIKWREANKVY